MDGVCLADLGYQGVGGGGVEGCRAGVVGQQMQAMVVAHEAAHLLIGAWAGVSGEEGGGRGYCFGGWTEGGGVSVDARYVAQH